MAKSCSLTPFDFRGLYTEGELCPVWVRGLFGGLLGLSKMPLGGCVGQKYEYGYLLCTW